MNDVIKYSTAYTRKRRAVDPEFKIALRDATRRYREKNKNNPIYLAKVKQYQLNRLIKYKKVGRIRKEKFKNYNITEAEYNTLHTMQNGVCAICKKAETALDSKGNKRKQLAIDHDHKTNIVRGLLCTRCNLGIGFLCDNTEFLKSAATYLEIFNAKLKDTN